MKKGKKSTRRNFFKHSTIAATGLIASPMLVNTTLASVLESDLHRSANGQTILFQGDSITDAKRDRANYYANAGTGMGHGYVYQIAAHLLGKYPEKQYNCYNRGISGHKVFQLANRWEDDCLMIEPDVLSILIGVNDFWHTKTHGFKGTAASYEKDFVALMERTKEALPDVKLMICEPFFVEGGTALKDDWFAAFKKYQEACGRVAKTYADVMVPFQSVFDEGLKTAPASYWCPDGVHPSVAGSHLMAKAWLEAFEKL